ncbi:MAG: hypothetical protein GEV12_10875 [Micromonosporaceae bacterium]|nr:hypothetical protein [Micromonosporaceae bacterium]
MTRTTTVAVIGLGSRGLSVLERIVTLAKRSGPAAGRLRVEVVDSRGDGAGVHTTDQPDYLLLNTTCSQVSMFPDSHTVGDEVDRPGPSLFEWVTARGLRLAADGCTTGLASSVGPGAREIRPTDFLPRRVLGEYLGWFFDVLRQRAPAHLELRLHRAAAVDLADSPGPPGGRPRLRLSLADGARLDLDYAFLTTGYTANQPATATATDTAGVGGGAGRPGVIAAPYPLPDQVAQVRPGQSVAIGGFGLSAMDLMSCLTVGRGGRFGHDGDECRYLPSGQEPKLLFYSRSGIPCRARPRVMRVDSPYEPMVFTPAAVERQRDGGGPLDFDRDVLPLVLTELRVAYRRCEAAIAWPDAARELDRDLADAGGPDGIGKLLDELDDQRGRFDARQLLEGGDGMPLGDATAYQHWLAEAIRADLADGRRGFADSPRKAALDVLRALRDTFRHTVDFGGLTDRSLAEFHRRTVPMLNRAVVGPQFERHGELLALLAAGVATAPFGPAPEVDRDRRTGRWTVRSTRLAAPAVREVDWVCSANVELPAVASSASPLIRALHRRGWLRTHRPGSGCLPGVDVAADQHPVRADGQPERRLWVLGPLCEGATYYNNLVPSPGMFSRPVFDAHRCVAAMFAAG